MITSKLKTIDSLIEVAENKFSSEAARLSFLLQIDYLRKQIEELKHNPNIKPHRKSECSITLLEINLSHTNPFIFFQDELVAWTRLMVALLLLVALSPSLAISQQKIMKI